MKQFLITVKERGTNGKFKKAKSMNFEKFLNIIIPENQGNFITNLFKRCNIKKVKQEALQNCLNIFK